MLDSWMKRKAPQLSAPPRDFVRTVFTRAKLNRTANPFSPSAISLSPMPASPSIRAFPPSLVTVIKRSLGTNPRTSDSYFLLQLAHFMVSYGWVHPLGKVLLLPPARTSPTF